MRHVFTKIEENSINGTWEKTEYNTFSRRQSRVPHEGIAKIQVTVHISG